MTGHLPPCPLACPPTLPRRSLCSYLLPWDVALPLADGLVDHTGRPLRRRLGCSGRPKLKGLPRGQRERWVLKRDGESSGRGVFFLEDGEEGVQQLESLVGEKQVAC